MGEIASGMKSTVMRQQPLKYSIVVYGAPHSSQGPYSAVKFIEALLSRGHEIYRVFFYHDGPLNGSSQLVSPQDDKFLPNSWHQLKANHQIDYVVCIGAGIKRGVINSTEATRYDKPSESLAMSFELSGLGQLVDASIHSDRVITFASH